jgi:hypothetical protein
MDYTPTTLRNKGVPVRFYELGPDGKPQYDEGGEPITEVVLLRLSAWDIAQIEEKYESHEKYGEAMKDAPLTTALRTLALAFDEDEKAIGRKMVTGHNADYITAVSTAWALAQGMDPTVAARMHQMGLDQAAQGLKAMAEMTSEGLDQAEKEASERLLSLTSDQPIPNSDASPPASSVEATAAEVPPIPALVSPPPLAPMPVGAATPSNGGPGTNGSGPGLPSDEPSTSSGT